MVLTDWVELFRFDQIIHRIRIYCTISRSSPVNCTVYLSLNLDLKYIFFKSLNLDYFFKSVVLLQQPIVPLEGSSAQFSNVYCIILKEMRGIEISKLLGRRHNSRWTHSPQTRSRNKMVVSWSYFRDFVGVQKIEDLTESIFFCSSTCISNKKQIRFSGKKLGSGPRSRGKHWDSRKTKFTVPQGTSH